MMAGVSEPIPSAQPAQAPKKKRLLWRWLVIALVVGLFYGWVVHDDTPSTALPPLAPASVAYTPEADYTPPAPPQVTYEVEGSADTVDVTIETPSGTSQESGQALPWTSSAYDGTEFQLGFLYVSAQNQGDTGTVTCRITVGDEVVAENTSTGEYSIAQCQGKV